MTLNILRPELLGKSPIPDASIKVYLRGSVVETDQRFAIQDVVEFTKPELEVTVRWVCMATSLEFVPTAITSTQWFLRTDFCDSSCSKVILCPEVEAHLVKNGVTLIFFRSNKGNDYFNYFRPKYIICQNRFQISSLKSIFVYRPGRLCIKRSKSRLIISNGNFLAYFSLFVVGRRNYPMERNK